MTNSLEFQAISGQTRHLTPIRALSPNIQLVRDDDQPRAAPPLVLKTVRATSPVQLDALLRDAAAWRRVCTSGARNVLQLHDVCVRRAEHTALFLMEHCAGGPVAASRRSERAALRHLAAMAAGLAAVLEHSDQPAHANLSASHVLLDDAAVPKLAGWGLVRAARLGGRRVLSERDDVKALTGILFEMLYGRRYDPSEPKLPSEPSVSPATSRLLRDVLNAPTKDAPELTVFRYDIAAARRLVPVCTAALSPPVKSRRGDLLIQDLNSVSGVKPSVATGPRAPTPKSAPVTAETGVRKQNGVSQRASPPVAENASQAAVRNDIAVAAVNVSAGTVEQPSNAEIEAVVRRITSGELTTFNPEDMDRIVDVCTQSDEAPAEVFRVLFRCPISKSPIVAFKAIVLIHHLISEGPAKVTALAITHDEFLRWIESSWSRARMQNKTGKIHMYSYCFAVGEIEWYTFAIRKRIETQAKFAQVFSTHWLARMDGLPSLVNTRLVAYRFVLEVLEKASTLLKKIMSSNDPAAIVKTSAAPMLVREVAKTYQVICWLYATAEAGKKSILEPELDVAHNAARAALNAVRAVPEIASKCPPSTLLDLKGEQPRNFDVAVLTNALRKKIKRKKRIVSGNGQDAFQMKGKNEAAEASDGEEQREGGGTVGEIRYNGEVGNGSGGEEDVVVEQGKKKSRKKSKEGLPATKPNAVRRKKSAEFDDRGHSDERVTAHRGQNGEHSRLEPSSSLNGHVRRGPRGEETNASIRERARISYRNRRNGGLARSISPVAGRRRLSAENRRFSRPEDSDSESEDSNPERVTRYYDTSPTSGTTPLRSNKKKGKKSKKDSQGDSDAETSPEGNRSKSKRTVTKKKKKKLAKSADDRASGSDTDPGSESDENTSTRARPVRRSLTDEKKIPFDKKPPKPKTRKKSKAKSDSDDDVEGSQKALEAAASGRKTPKMDPTFEVAPFEVQFGPQIGSGGFGVVFKAKFRNETVAVKKIHAHALSNAASVAEFQSEVAVLCTLEHPNILRFMGACTKPPHLMIITEYMARGTLFDVLHQSQMQVSWPMRKKFALDTCEGMRYLHASKLLHRDLKSSNLMLDKDFNCKVGDFGLTRISGGAAAVQMTGQCGTFQYMAVEVLANKPYSEKADVFSFGILLWEMVARKLPYFGMQPMQVGIAVLRGLRPTVPAKCPLPLAKLMRACWDSDPEKRPSFAQLVKALESMPE